MLHLAHEVVEVADGRRGRIGNAVRGHDLEHVLLLRQAAAHVRPGRRGGGLGAERRERAFWMPVFMYASLS